jgi:hypothetical protein
LTALPRRCPQAVTDISARRRRVEEGVVRPIRKTAIAATLMASALTSYVATSPPVRANSDGFAINGTYTATSDGTYATTDYAFHNEATVRTTWTITSHCTTDDSCSGKVTSDQGWSSPLTMEVGHIWHVERDVPDWETCPDGMTFTGHQTFTFYPSNADGLTQIGSPYLEGRDKTAGPRYACDSAKYGKWLTIVMPFRLDKIPS